MPDLLSAPVYARSGGETIETVISVVCDIWPPALPLAGRSIVGHREDIAHRVKRIGVVHDGCASAVDRKVAESAAVVVGVECLRTVAVFQVAALLELVIAQFGDVVVTVGLLAANLFKKTSEVVGVSDLSPRRDKSSR